MMKSRHIAIDVIDNAFGGVAREVINNMVLKTKTKLSEHYYYSPF